MALIKKLDPECLSEVEYILTLFPVEEVQGCVNQLVNDSEWLRRHRDLHAGQTDLVDYLIGEMGRRPIL